MGKLTISMAIFNSYVSLPEDNQSHQTVTDVGADLPKLWKKWF